MANLNEDTKCVYCSNRIPQYSDIHEYMMVICIDTDVYLCRKCINDIGINEIFSRKEIFFDRDLRYRLSQYGIKIKKMSKTLSKSKAHVIKPVFEKALEDASFLTKLKVVEEKKAKTKKKREKFFFIPAGLFFSTTEVVEFALEEIELNGQYGTCVSKLHSFEKRRQIVREQVFKAPLQN
ncbi:MAG: hypothetical protein QY321_01150 [Patescibacteria group bacterium]|nr:MAG: hypothetical protein QY321_01150 [Patescibacteria group bacterium]